MSAFLVLGPGDSGRYFLELFPHSTSSWPPDQVRPGEPVFQINSQENDFSA